MNRLAEIPDKVTFFWHKETKSIIAKWEHLFVENEVFKSVINYVIEYAKENNAISWIFDASSAKSLFKQDVLEEVKNSILPKIENIEIKYFIIITEIENSFAKLTEKKIKKEVKKNQIEIKNFKTLYDAILWLKENNNKQ